MRTIDPSILLAAMATLETAPVPAWTQLPPPNARVVSRPRRVTFAPLQPAAISAAS